MRAFIRKENCRSVLIVFIWLCVLSGATGLSQERSFAMIQAQYRG